MRPGRIIGCADRAGGVAEELAVLAYLVKPVRDSELAAAIEIAVARFEEWRELERKASRRLWRRARWWSGPSASS